MLSSHLFGVTQLFISAANKSGLQVTFQIVLPNIIAKNYRETDTQFWVNKSRKML